ncbi:MAG TPA: hypothetical protein DHV27_13475 [Psychrobacter sp.]|nr:hypothetical protein [Pseudomonas lundensis]HCI77246.1 hypothetical protein [Psychrobacter sp.]
MIQCLSLLKSRSYQRSIVSMIFMATVSVQAAPTVTAIDVADPTLTTPVPAQPTKNSVMNISDTLAAQLQPSDKALSDANQQLLSRNAQLQRELNDLQTQVNVLVYESKGQLFLYGAFTVLISLLVGIFVSWLVFVRRERW